MVSFSFLGECKIRVCLLISGGLDSAALTNLIRGGLFELGLWSPKRHAGVAQVSVGEGLRSH